MNCHSLQSIYLRRYLLFAVCHSFPFGLLKFDFCYYAPFIPALLIGFIGKIFIFLHSAAGRRNKNNKKA